MHSKKVIPFCLIPLLLSVATPVCAKNASSTATIKNEPYSKDEDRQNLVKVEECWIESGCIATQDDTHDNGTDVYISAHNTAKANPRNSQTR